MCGLVGYIAGLNTPYSIELEDAAKTLFRRGPDNSDQIILAFDEKELGLAHTRLSIVDHNPLSNQPFQFDNLYMVFNGEIYNHNSIRKELETLGYVFQTMSDTEVLIKAYAKWGKACFKKFDGMWAVVIFDKLANSLLLSRDHFGEKPLYYFLNNESVAFGSTLKSLIQFSSITEKVDQISLQNTIDDGFNFTSRSMLTEISKVPANTCIEIDLQTFSEVKQSIGIFDKFSKGKEKFSIKKFETILLTSLERRLIADVPICLLLSGGIDSTYVAALAKRELNTDLTCITISDNIGGQIETDRARKATDILGLQHDVIHVQTNDLVSIYEESLKAMDEPMCDPSFPMLVDLISHVPSNYKVLMTGDGADELFLSYSNYKRILHSSMNGIRINEKFISHLYSIISHLPPKISRYFKFIFDKSFSQTSTCSLLNDLTYNQSNNRRNALRNELLEIATDKSNNFALFFNAYFYELAEYLLVKTDKASMYHSKEARTPFLSAQLREYIFNCDQSTIGLGNKEHIKDRLLALLGQNLAFEKRGFFASGQNYLPKLGKDDKISPHLAKTRYKNNLNTSKQYRLKVLNDWLLNEY